jgi:hypothetical protein
VVADGGGNTGKQLMTGGDADADGAGARRDPGDVPGSTLASLAEAAEVGMMGWALGLGLGGGVALLVSDDDARAR